MLVDHFMCASYLAVGECVSAVNSIKTKRNYDFIVTSADTVRTIELLDKIKTGKKLAEDFDVGTSTI